MRTSPQHCYGWPRLVWLILIAFIHGIAITGFPANSARPLGVSELQAVRFDQRLDQQISLDLNFLDDSGRQTRLQSYFDQKPVLLILGYYGCPMLCGLVLNGVVESLQDLKPSVGKEFDVVFVSVDPRETPALALAKKRTYVRRYGRPASEPGWHFLTGSEADVHKLAEQIGFRYAYDPISKQFAHASGFVILTPQGRTARYFFGLSYSAQDLSFALKTAGSNRVSSPIQELLLLCFHYAPVSGKYGALVVVVMRVMAVTTLLLLAMAIVVWVRRDRRKASVLKGQPA
jgi:protein SCO1/2